MEIYEQPNRLKLILAIVAAALGVFLIAVSFYDKAASFASGLTVVVALGLFVLSVLLFWSYFNRALLLRADESGVLTMFLFYLPWSEIDGFYLKDDSFIEIRLKDADAYIENMDRDLYVIYYDEIESAQNHGHEPFFFPVSHMGLDPQTTLNFFETARKNYDK